MGVKRTHAEADLSADACVEPHAKPPPCRRPDRHPPPAWSAEIISRRCHAHPQTTREIRNEYGTEYDGYVDVAALRDAMRVEHDLYPHREYKRRHWADIAALRQLITCVAETPLRPLTHSPDDDPGAYGRRHHAQDTDIKTIVHKHVMRAMNHLYATGTLDAGVLANALHVRVH